MLIKEYHIPLPLTLEEYKIAQLYMIQKKSREESEGTESGVEIIENRPYTDGPFGGGQYTYKVYHIGRHIPGWLRGMVPKTALEVHEESWNAYPRTKTKFSVPFVEKFTLEIDTVFQQDGGTQENIFNLTRAELRNRDIDTIDIVNDSLVGSDYKEEEDPSLFVSDKSGRGPLPDDWIANPPNGIIMCSYKLIKVEFRYWGLQSRIERFIHDYGLRRVMLRAHRQAWAWQDEWVGLTMDDIRRLERETKLILQRKLGKADGGEGGEGEGEEIEEDEGCGACGNDGTTVNRPINDSVPAPPMKRYSIPASSSTSLPPNFTAPDMEEASFCPLDNIAIHEDSDSEYFDAREDVSDQDTDSDEFLDPTPQPRPHTEESYHTDDELDEDDTSTPMLPTGPAPHPRSILLLVTLTGGVLNSDIEGGSADIDLQMMRETFEDVYSKHYQTSLSKVVLKFVLCPKITSGVCDLLQSILPPSSPQGNSNFPFTALPLLLLEDQSYYSSVNSLIERLNSVYCQFKQSEEGVNFSGDVCIVSDSVSSLMVYDILTRPSTPLLSSRAHLSSSSNHLDGGSSDEGHSPSLRSVSVPSGSKSVPSARKGGGALELPGLRGHASSLLSSLLFNVSKFFTFGSPLGLVLSLKKLRGVSLSRPKCSSLYNLFYAVDPLGFRLEPLLDDTFSTIDPLLIPCYLIYPTGDKSSVALSDFVSYVATDEGKGRGSGRSNGPSASNECLFVLDEELKKSDTSRNDHKSWWGSDRIDYVLQAPSTLEGVVSLPNTSYGHIVQSRYLEAKELASFVLRQVSMCKGHGAVSVAAATSRSGFFVPFTPFTSTVKWAKRKTPLRIQKMSPNHRAVDIVIASHSTQLPHLQAKFFYGPLNMATLSGEMVNMFILSPDKESLSLEDNEEDVSERKKERAWSYLDSTSTDKHGRISYPLSPEQVPSTPGVYPLIYLVKGDHTLAISNMFVLPSYTEAVVFSIDGALCSSFSLSGRDMRLKPGALEVTKLWQEQGYLLIYITGRPIFQKEYITSWLTLQGFPLGIVSFSDTLSTDAQNTKLLYLARLMKEARVILCGAYGSVRHLSVYKELGLQPDQIYLHGNNKKASSSVGKGKSEYQLLSDGFTGHLRSFKLRPAVVNMNSIIGQYKFDYSDMKQSQQQQKAPHHSSSPSLHGSVSGTND